MISNNILNPNFLFAVSVSGAGQEVGKSCVVVSMNGKRIMFDCGMDMAYHDHRRHPDFSRLSQSGDFDAALTCIVITHLYGLPPPFDSHFIVHLFSLIKVPGLVYSIFIDCAIG
jgi:predicted metal-dependent RNase